jgi:hypothetical protein
MRTARSSLRLALCCAVGFGLVAAVISPARAQMQSASPLPTAKEVVARYDKALGGEAAFRRHNSSTMRGTLEIEGAMLPFTFYASAPYLRLEKVSLPGNRGDALNGFDGELAWGFDPRTGAQISTGDERESAKRDADFYYPLDELTWFKSMETVGVEEFEGRRCYRLRGVNNWNKANDHFYDVETGLLAGYEFESDAGGAATPTHMIFSDYHPVDGVLVPMKQVAKIKPKSNGDWTVLLTMTYTSVTFNDVDPAVFAPPQAVRDLAAKAKPNPGS